MACKGTCFRHKAIKPIGRGRYAAGQKRCQTCSIFIKWESFFVHVVDTDFGQNQGTRGIS